MSGIYGIIRFDGAPVDPADLATMRAAMAEWGPEGGTEWHAGVAGMGQLLFIDTPEAANEVLPRVMADGKVLTAAARIDNREDLFRELSVPHELREGMPDSVLIERAYLRWGEACAVRLLGDWSFAVWDPATRRFFLARDHHGNTALYYTVNERFLAFASGRKALLALDIGPVELDDLYIAQVLLARYEYFGERTAHLSVRRLPPSHSLVTTNHGMMQAKRYWYMEDVVGLQYKSFDEYVEAFLEIWDEAVRARVRSSGKVAVMMSSGLDSTLVAATAGLLLGTRGKSLHAYTAIPLHDPTQYVSTNQAGDEWPLARATADYVGNIGLHPVPADDVTPLEGVREMLRIVCEPIHGAVNAYWIVSAQRMARAHGVRVLMTGGEGNVGLSWRGLPPTRWSLGTVARQVAVRLWPSALRALQHYRSYRRDHGPLCPEVGCSVASAGCSPVSSEHSFSASHQSRSLRWRLRALMPGRQSTGASWHENGAAHQLAVRDPTGDVRVLSYALGVPDRFFRDPESGRGRWLARSCMLGRVPEEVRLNTRRGLQAADIVARLRSDCQAMTSTIRYLGDGPACRLIRTDWLEATWQRVVDLPGDPDLHSEGAALLRAIMAGLLLNDPMLDTVGQD